MGKDAGSGRGSAARRSAILVITVALAAAGLADSGARAAATERPSADSRKALSKAAAISVGSAPLRRSTTTVSAFLVLEFIASIGLPLLARYSATGPFAVAFLAPALAAFMSV